MEAQALLVPACEAQLHDTMNGIYQALTGRDLAQDFGRDWQQFYPFPQIPVALKRAPVFSSEESAGNRKTGKYIQN